MGLDIDIIRNTSKNTSIIDSQSIYYSNSFAVMAWLDKRLEFQEGDTSAEVSNEILLELKDILQNIENLQYSKKTSALNDAKFAFYHDHLKHNTPQEREDIHNLLTALIQQSKIMKKFNNSTTSVYYIYSRNY